MVARIARGPWLSHLLLLSLAGLMIYPLLWLISSSLKPTTEIFSTMNLIPSELHFENYIQGWLAMPNFPFSLFLRNSIFVSSMAIIGNLFSSTLVAYGFSRIDFRFKKPLLALLLATLMLPHQAQLVPQYIVFKNLDWINSFKPLVVPPFLGNAFFIFLMIQFMRGLPREFDESAQIDGCNKFQIYLRIILPLCKPAMATVAIFSFLWSWDAFLDPVVYLSNPKLFTVPLGLRLFLDNTANVSWGGLFAMSVISLIPNLVLFLVGQRHFVEGITASGLKG